jgi:glycosyltransferase involved in cell wall biosynthesis
MTSILSIAIPAYKRPEQLGQCIASIASQLANHAYDANIIVFDDSLSNINKITIESARAKYSCNIELISNSKNFGIDGNIENCLSYGCSDYLLVLGEDDVLLPGAMREIFNIINEHKPDLIYTSYVYLSNDKKSVIRSPRNLSGFQETQRFIENDLWSIGFIGATVINRRFLNKKTKRYLGTFFNHVGRISLNLEPQSIIFSSKVPLVGNRSDDLSSTTWSSSYYDVLFGYEDLMKILSQDSRFGESFLKSLVSFRSAFGYLDIHRICLMRSHGVYNRSIYNRYIANSEGIRLKILYWVASRIPPQLFFPLKSIFKYARVLKRLTYKKFPR